MGESERISLSRLKTAFCVLAADETHIRVSRLLDFVFIVLANSASIQREMSSEPLFVYIERSGECTRLALGAEGQTFGCRLLEIKLPLISFASIFQVVESASARPAPWFIFSNPDAISLHVPQELDISDCELQPIDAEPRMAHFDLDCAMEIDDITVSRSWSYTALDADTVATVICAPPAELLESLAESGAGHARRDCVP